MMLTQYNYLFALGVIFAAFDTWNIGASIFEFAGALGVGARVTDTIRTKIVSPGHYVDQTAVLMLVKKAFALIPFSFSLTAILFTMLLIWKGGSYEINLTEGGIAGAIIGTGISLAL
ncbi:hypothetical protein RRF57_011723 [Xylaria bambusicola]|uniref:Uncharacterized protein n=1 Tax=Xylaria bambusicola TaxID=326684 RepID=A0AAN7UZW0_9PEZI